VGRSCGVDSDVDDGSVESGVELSDGGVVGGKTSPERYEVSGGVSEGSGMSVVDII
jgi:hypothetical protein